MSDGNIHLSYCEASDEREGQIAIVTFDRPNCSANKLDQQTLEELDHYLDVLEQQSRLKGVIFISAKPTIFIAGADLELLERGMGNPDILSEYLEFGQRLFNRISHLSVPTVAVIHGACVGGGYELALACTHRVASDAKVTKIGLPETKLGIIPAWGGTSRLPLLIGVPNALDVILGGKTPPAKAAKKLGMVDQVVPKEWLMKAAIQAIRKGKEATAVPDFLKGVYQKAVALAVDRKVRGDLQHRTRGHYPAPEKAFEIIMASAGERHIEASLERERKAVIELAGRPECRQLFHVYMLQEKARHGTRVEGESITHTAVIGAGVMGSGIAQWISSKGISVVLQDIDVERVGAGMRRIAATYHQAVERRLMPSTEAREGMERVIPAATPIPLPRVQLIIEAAVENLTLKKEIFRKLDERAPAIAILATNTSALPVGEIAQVTDRPDRVIGLHFFNPVHRMPLVEVVIPEGVSDEVRNTAVKFVGSIGKLPLVVKDSPGFLVNRILLPYLVEAAVAFDAGLDAVTIDNAMLDFGMPNGPLRLADEVGLDVALEVAETLAAAFPDRMEVPQFLRKMVESGLLGRKSGAGFYRYPSGQTGEPQANLGAEAFRSVGLSSALPEGMPKLEIEQEKKRMIFRMLDEAARCLEERVVECPGDVDFGMVMGTGFPPFRGGPLRYADSLGLYNVAAEMEMLGMRPCGLLARKAANKEGFYEVDKVVHQ